MDIIYKIHDSQNLNKRLTNLESKCNEIEKKLDIIIELLTKNSKSCNKMSEHIDFVENVYENVKHPLSFICNKINSIVSQKSIKNKENKNDLND